MRPRTVLASAASVALVAGGVVAGASAAAADSPRQDVFAAARAATAKYHDISKAVGFAELKDAAGIACIDNPAGGMGIHYVNGVYLKDEAVDLAKPEAVMYEPMPDGTLALIAVEYITTKGPAALENHLFSFTGTPNRYGLPAFYELHVWAWKPNPAGTFADMNMDVSCDAAK